MRAARRTRGERGQAITEYALTVTAVFLTVGICVYEFAGFIGEFYLNVVKLVSLPFP